MKQVFTRVCVLILLCMAGNVHLTGQNAENNMKLIFSRNTDGKVATMNAVGQKVFNFLVEGIANEKQSDDFIRKFKGKEKVIYVYLSVSNEEKTTYKAIIVMDQQAKLQDFKELLKDAGFSEISIDGKVVSVDELEVLKLKNKD